MNNGFTEFKFQVFQPTVLCLWVSQQGSMEEYQGEQEGGGGGDWMRFNLPRQSSSDPFPPAGFYLLKFLPSPR